MSAFQVVAMGLTEFLEPELPPRGHMIDPWLPEHGLAMVFAPRGVGKSFFAMELSAAVATGKDFLGWAVPKARSVLYIDGEMSAPDVKARYCGILPKYPAVNGEKFRLITPDLQEGPCPDLSTAEGQRSLEPYTTEAELIIVDNISTLCRTGTENDAESWASVQLWALRMRASGKSVIFIHHAGKNGDQRGTSKREDVMDTIISLQIPNEHEPSQGASFELKFTKSRGFSGADAQSMLVEMFADADDTYQWNYESPRTELIEQVLAERANGLSMRDVAKKLKLSKTKVGNICKEHRLKESADVPLS